MKDFDKRKNNERETIRVMGDENPSEFFGDRLNTEESTDRIRFLENSLLPITRRDTMGGILSQ